MTPIALTAAQARKLKLPVAPVSQLRQYSSSNLLTTKCVHDRIQSVDNNK
jgi:hypothetical protein